MELSSFSPRSEVEVDIRPSWPTDVDALAALVDRCSDDTLYRRFHGAAAPYVRREVERVASGTWLHRSWVAVADGAIRGTATLAWDRSGETDIAVLVEDTWFRRGIGRALLDRLMTEASRRGVDVLGATVQADNDRAVRFLRGVAPEATVRFAGGAELDVQIPVGRLGRVGVPDRRAAHPGEAA
ncbi:MAG: GNAT family N-acetyltransferase [Acidimicrobiales bacterium]